ncbi:hypothetical protein N8500_01250 [Candidatus Puniceispirillum sp.]|nr:hypothetical protein [Candidatus Puniceispirillum sp.]
MATIFAFQYTASTPNISSESRRGTLIAKLTTTNITLNNLSPVAMGILFA